MTISGRVHNNKWIRKGRKMWKWNESSVILSCLTNINSIKSYILSMPFILTDLKSAKIKISLWKLWTQICTHSLITSVMAAYADIVNKQLKIYGELMFIDNFLIVNIMKLKTPLCFTSTLFYRPHPFRWLFSQYRTTPNIYMYICAPTWLIYFLCIMQSIIIMGFSADRKII